MKDRWTPHDLRRSFASRAGDLGVAPHVIALACSITPFPAPFALFANVPERSEWFPERQQAATDLAAHIAALVLDAPKGAKGSA